MAIYCVTFGQRFRHDLHPFFGKCPRLPESYVEVIADDYVTAVDMTQDLLSYNYSMVYSLDDFHDDLFPCGPIGAITRENNALTYTPNTTWAEKYASPTDPDSHEEL
jgi:hypothetical protein